MSEITADSLLHLIADNDDHNARTLDGEHVIHTMGQSGAFTPTTPKKKSSPKSSMEDIRKIGQIIFQKDI